MKEASYSLLVLLVMAGLVLASAGCQPAAPEATEPPAAEPTEEAAEPAVAATEVLKVGVLSPFSGPGARTGEEIKGAVELAFEAIDYQIGQYEIELVWIDSQSDPAKGAQAYEQAVVQDGIQAGLLDWHSSVAVSCMDIAAKHKIPHFFGFAATEVINEKYESDPEKYSYWMGKTWPSAYKLSIAYVTALEDAIAAGTWAPEKKTAFIWGEDTDWGRSFGGAIKGQFEDAGWEIVGEDYFPLEQSEFYPLWNKVKDLNPAVIAGTSTTPPQISALIKQADEVGLEGLIVADGLGWVGEWYDLTGSSSNYVLDQIPQFASAEAQQWAVDFEEKYGIAPGPSAAGQSFDMANFFIKVAERALEKHGELTSETLYEVGQSELWTGQLVYTDGMMHTRYEYNETSIPDPVVGKGYFIFPVLQYMDGEGIIAWPDEWATGKLVGKGAEAIRTEPEPVEATREFKLGVLAPFSGPSARTGEEFRGSVEMAFENIDYQIGDYKIELVWVDSQSDPAKATQAYEQAIVQDGIQAGALNWHSSVAVACMDIAAKHKIPHFFPFGATEVIDEKWHGDPEKYGYWLNKGWPIPKKLSISYVEALENAIERGLWTPDEKTVAIYGEDTDWGRSFAGAITGQFEDAGWEIIAEEYVPLEQTEFYPLLNKFKDMNPAVVAGTITGLQTCSAFIKQADEVGLESFLVADGLGWFGEWYELMGSSSDYALDQIPGWATDEGKAFAQEFEAKYGFPPSSSAAGLAYDGINLFIQSAQHTFDEYGELTSETLYTWASENLQTGKWSYTDGIVMSEYKYTPETVPDPVVGPGYYIFPVLQYFDGVGKVVFPTEWAEQDIQPKP